MDQPCILLSIGTGRPDKEVTSFADEEPGWWTPTSIWSKMKNAKAIWQHMQAQYTAGEKDHEALKLKANGEYLRYKRLNPTGLERMPLDEWEGYYGGGTDTMKRIDDAVMSYIYNECEDEQDSFGFNEWKLIQAA